MKSCLRKFRFGENGYVSTREVKIPIIMLTQMGTELKKDVIASLIGKEEELFLCRLIKLVYWKETVFYEENKLEFTFQSKRVKWRFQKGDIN